MISNKFAAVFTMMGLFLMACSDGGKRDNPTDPGANNYSASSENDNSANDGSDFVVDTSYTSASVNVSGRGSVASLDVVIRDFQPGHSDFENFSEEYAGYEDNISGVAKNTKMGPYTTACGGTTCVGYDAVDWYQTKKDYHNWCGNEASDILYRKGLNAGYPGVAINTSGNPMAVNPYLPSYLQTSAAVGDTLKYGECSDKLGSTITYRGYSNKTAGAFNSGDNSACPSGIDWAQPVIFTPGMVQKYLTFDNMATGDYLNGVHIAKAAEECDNSNFAQWFADVPGVNMRMETTLDIPAVTGQAGYYELNYNYSNGGYFPLDSIDPATSARVGYKAGTESMQWGPQSLSIYCPPYAYEQANTQTDDLGQSTYALCQLWLGNGGPRNSGAAQTAAGAGGALGLQHLRNHNFTMMGFAKFKYYAANQTTGGEVFDFAGDDDMWIYVDGVLAVDLGGTHLPVPGKVNVKTLADNGHGCAEGPLAATAEADGRCAGGVWKDNSWHYLHFFYADRQTDGSDFYIRTSIAEMAAPTFGQPRILHAELTMNDNGSFTTALFVSSQLNQTSVDNIINSGAVSTYFPILAIRKNATGTLDTLAYKVTGFSYTNTHTSEGYVYTLTGNLCTDMSCSATAVPAVGDSLAFNYPTSIVDPTAFTDYNKFNYSDANLQIVSTTGKAVTGLTWGAITKSTVKIVSQTVPTDTTIDRPAFETIGSGSELPNNATGEILVSPLPTEFTTAQSEWLNNNLSTWTTSPSAGSSIAAGGTANSVNGHSTYLLSSTASSKCYSQAGSESFMSIAFVAEEPFQVSVRVFDNLGHFISQYQESLSESAFAAAISDGTADRCHGTVNGISKESQAVTSGFVLATVKMYPVSQNGRKLATGPYIYQVSIIQKPMDHCVNVNGSQTYMLGQYNRTYKSMTRGYRRIDK